MNPTPFGIFSSVSSPRTAIRNGVDLFYPASILANGTVLIDTPGIGSTHRHNTEAALQVLPECDAVLFVASADPPITEVELDYLRRVQSKTTRIFFILNKADYLTPEDQRRVAKFLRKVLRDSRLDTTAPVFCVSARDGLTAKPDKCPSGIAAVEDHVLHYLATEKVQALEDAIMKKTTAASLCRSRFCCVPAR